jgi:hypothetical protein
MAKVVYANECVTVPVYFDTINKNEEITRSRTLLPGEYIPLTDVPNYMKELVAKGDAYGVSLRDMVLNKKEKKEQVVEETEE